MTAETNQYSIHSMCRTCLEFLENDVYDLFDIPGLARKLQLCTSLSVEQQDGFPKNICGICYTRLNEFHDFHKQCIASVRKLQEMIDNKVFTSEPKFDALETDAAEINDTETALNAEDDAPLNSDPLQSHKIEPKEEGEDDVLKMLVDVEEFIKEIPITKERKRRKSVSFNYAAKNNRRISSSSESSSESDNADDLDFDDDKKSVSSSDDDLPLVLRIRKAREVDTFKPKPGPKPKRKRIPAKERHLHTIIECHICHQKFKKVVRYQEHMKHHDDKLQFQCTFEDCAKGFTTANGLRLHIEHAHTETVNCIPCTQEGCKSTFTRTRLLNAHLKRDHKIERLEPRSYPCPDCEKVFRCQMALKKHMFVHDGKELPFPCNICGKRFVINSALRDHLMRHAGIKNFVCPYCGVGKTTRQELNTHINTHTREKKFQCPHCPHASHNKQNLRKHVRVVHEKVKDFACQFCGKTFGKSNACKMHEITHTGAKRCECKVCGKSFLYPKGLTKHLRTHEKLALRHKSENKTNETSETPVDPMQAFLDRKKNEEQEMASAAILKACAESVAAIPKNPRRVERVDIAQLAGTAVNPIPSVAVPSWSPQTNQLVKEGPFICPDCGQHFNFQGNFRKHHRIVHQGIKDYACRFCPKRFAKADTLRHHEMTHTGEKPHECHWCGKRFIQSVTLKRHLNVHTKKLPPDIKCSDVDVNEELHLQEQKIREEQQKKEKERAAIAEAAREQLEELDKMAQQEETT